MTNADRQSAYRKRRTAKLERLEAFASWCVERLDGNDKALAIEIRDRAKEALG